MGTLLGLRDAAGFNLDHFLRVLFGAFLGVGGGMALNDWVDRKIDVLEAIGMAGDFARHLSRIPRRPADGRRLVAFLGGTIGNLTPDEQGRRAMDQPWVRRAFA